MSFIRGMKKADIGVNDVSDVVEIMKLNLKSQTTQFKHFLIYQIGACNRPAKVEVDNRAEPLKGISKFHSIWITEDGELRGSVLSCEDCTVKWRCGKCQKKSLSSSSFQCSTCLKTFGSKLGVIRHSSRMHK